MTVVQEEAKIKIITKNETKRERKQLNLKTVNKFLFSLIFLAGISYVALTNQMTIAGFELRDTKKSIKELGDVNKNLENKALTLNSYNDMNEKVKALSMVSVERMNYVEDKSGSLAIK